MVTSFDFQTHPLGPIVAFAATFYPLEDADKILPRWRDYCESCPEEVTSSAITITLPAAPMLPEPVHNKACLFVGGLYVGDSDKGMKTLQPLRQLATPLADISQPMPFTFIQSAFDPFFPLGRLQSYWKAQYLNNLSDDAIKVIASRAKTRPHPLTLVNTFHMGGAINRVKSTDTAFGERSANWMSSIDGNWEDPHQNEKNIAWVREGFDQIARFGNGSTYTNFMGQEDEASSALTAKAYGPNLEKLRKIKSVYDPHNFFRMNLNITPA